MSVVFGFFLSFFLFFALKKTDTQLISDFPNNHLKSVIIHSFFKKSPLNALRLRKNAYFCKR